MRNSKLLYRTLSVYQYYKNIFFRLLALAVVAFAIWLYDNNHIAMAVIGTIAFITFLFIGEAELKVYSNRITYRRTSVIPVSRKVFYLNEIRSFSIKGVFDKDRDVSTDVNVFAGTSLRQTRDPYNAILITYNNGSTVTINTHIYIEKLKEATRVISTLL
jgi:hypothetical protein